MMRNTTRTFALVAVAAMALPVTSAMAAASPKAGQSCKVVGQKSGKLVCTAKGRKKVWAAAPATTLAPVTTAAASGGSATTAAPAPAGLQKAPGFDGSTISLAHLGNVAGGPFASGGKALTAGFNAVIESTNAKGGVAGKYKINNIFAETSYNPETTVAKFEELKDKVVMVGEVYGTPNLVALLPRLRQANMIGSPISLDAEWVKDPNILPNGGTYQGQAMNIVDWWYSQNKGKKVCYVAHTGPYGDAGVEGFDLAQKSLGFDAPTAGKIRIAATESNVAAIATQLRSASCDGVFVAIASAQSTGILAFAAQAGYFPTLLGLAPAYDVKQVTNQTEALYTRQFYVAVDGVQWGDSSVAGMAPMIADLKAYANEYAGDINAAFMWGYVEAKTVVALLEKAVALGDLSRDGMKKAMAQLGKPSLGGLYPEYNYVAPAQRVPSFVSNIMAIDVSVPGGMKYATNGKSYEASFAKNYVHRCWPKGGARP